ncbi:fructosamine kinase family protein [Thiomicrorhabdus indica]|uniref:fructosamine kinase family protein n=1 Tax=Thiomicrorhabdus indica TaxID=2267253 RepID=UPI002AA8B8EF|nr:fructosamine kinase family protein [Thiomicrorhabdus indica]
MNWQDFARTLSSHLGKPIDIQSASAVHGGDINQAYRLQTSLGDLFIKLNQSHFLPMMQAEAVSLDWIANTNTLTCPKPLATGEFNNQCWLVMPFHQLTSHGDDAQRGRALAEMHQQIRKEPTPFGWFNDNFIGKTLQKNTWQNNWARFYGEQRLRPQLELSRLNAGSQRLFDLGNELIEHLDFWFEDYQPVASLLHGDLWAGNSAFLVDGSPFIFDPASYFGDRETDLAMTELFGGYSSDFYRGYNEVFPLNKGYQQRRELYNLYHILNHFNLFGGHYAHQATNTIENLIRQANA